MSALPVALTALALLGGPALPHAVTSSADPSLPVQVAPIAFDPEARGRADRATIVATPAVGGTLSIAILSGAGRTVAEPLPARSVVAGERVVATWDGADVADGSYAVRARLVDATGAALETTAEVRVDTAPPTVRLAAPDPVTATGPAVRLRGSATDATGAERALLEVAAQDGGAIGTVPLRLDGDRLDVRWDLRVRGRLLLPGAYRLRVRAVDGVGRVGRSPERVLRVERGVRGAVVASGSRQRAQVALTFDDCFDGAAWARMLEVLDGLDAKASFFCNGVYIRSFAASARRTVRDGHTIGSHTWSHPEMPSLSAAEQRRQIQRDVDAWWSVARASPAPWFRPPYGLHDASTRAQAGALGFAYVAMWDVDPSDYLNPPVARLVDHVVGRSQRGSIVVLHVNPNTAAALPAMIRGLRARGLEPVSLDELMGPSAHLSPRRGRG